MGLGVETFFVFSFLSKEFAHIYIMRFFMAYGGSDHPPSWSKIQIRDDSCRMVSQIPSVS